MFLIKYFILVFFCMSFLLSCSDNVNNLGEQDKNSNLKKSRLAFDALEEDCDCNRFYLEDILNKYTQNQQELKTKFSKKCFILGLKRAEINGGPFKHSGYLRCKNQKPKECLIDKLCKNKTCKYASRPCINKKYVNTLHSAFLEVNQCLGLDPRLSFPLYMHESQLHLSRRSWTGALCSGQMTSIAVADINRSSFAAYKNNPDCKKVFSYFTKIKTRLVNNRYAMLNSAKCDITNNPYTCFMYSLMVYKKNINRMQVLRTQFDLSSIFTQPKKVLEAVGIWSYNGGYGVIRILKLYLQEHQSDKNISFIQFWKDFKIHWIAKYYKWGGPSRVKEVQRFVEKVARDLIKAPNSPEGHLYTKAKGKQGVLCSSSRSFVNDPALIKAIMP